MNEPTTDELLERLVEASAAVAHAEGIYSAGARRELDDALAAVKASMPATPPAEAAPVGVAIKPLEWREGNTHVWLAERYSISNYEGMAKPYALSGITNSWTKEHFRTIEEAKAAAQADFNQRILSCITSPAKADTDAIEAAATDLVQFAWSAVVTDCTESAEYLNSLVGNLRRALSAAPSQGGDAK